jgi:DNA-binding MarR family transcriptional regulator
MEQNYENKDISEKATIAMIIKRMNAMRILLFLSKDADTEEAYYLQEISDNLCMNEMTAFNNLNKLVEAELIVKSEAKGNKKNKYYTISDRKLAEKVIEKYKHYVGFQLARLVPYKKQYCSQLTGDQRFQNACEELGVTISEGIQSVLSCYKIGKESTGLETIIWRREQGYDGPEKEKFVTEVEDIG